MKKNIIIISLISVLVVGVLMICLSISHFGGVHERFMENSNFLSEHEKLIESNNQIGNIHSNMNHNEMLNENQMIPKEGGQGAFSAIVEIVSILNADKSTNWDKVNITALKEHLMDMDLIIKDTDIKETKLKYGIKLEITSNNKRTIEAIWRMIPAHTNMVLSQTWDSNYTKINNGEILIVRDSKNFKEIQGLGFYGIIAYGGNHHQVHHMELAKGVKLFN